MKKLKIFVTYSNTPNCIDAVLKDGGMHPNFSKDIYIPILGGAALYNGDNKFFNEILHDNDGKNISPYNANINEGSIIFWLHKNIEKIEPFDYIGHCHYRRLFGVEKEEDLNEKTIFINQYKMQIPVSTQLIVNHSPTTVEKFTEFTFKFIRSFPEEEMKEFIYWMSESVFFAWHHFIMHKTLFKKYATEMEKYYSILIPMLYPIITEPNRSAAMISERLSSFVIWRMLKHDSSLKVKQGKYEKLYNCSC